MAAKLAKKAGKTNFYRFAQKPYGSRNLNSYMQKNLSHPSIELGYRREQSNFVGKNSFEVLAESEGKNPRSENHPSESPNKLLTKPWTERIQNRVSDFFTIEGLDKQLRIFI